MTLAMKHSMLAVVIAFAVSACAPRPTMPPPASPSAQTTTPPAATSAPESPPDSAVNGRYLMSFHACDPSAADCSNPRSHNVYLAQSDDGQSWTLIPGWQPYPGSVPDVIRRGNTLYIYTASGEVVKYHLDTGQADPPLKTAVEGLATGYADPSLTIDSQGRLVLFFLNGFVPGGDPARCPAGQTTCEKYIDSAVEAEGSDGVKFALESGHRITVTLGAGQFDSASDPDIFFDGQQYVLYLSHGQRISVWTSPDLSGEFSLTLEQLSDGAGVPSGFFDSTAGEYWSFGHANEKGAAVIRRAVHTALAPLGQSDWITVISGASLGLGDTARVESPGFAVNVP